MYDMIGSNECDPSNFPALSAFKTEMLAVFNRMGGDAAIQEQACGPFKDDAFFSLNGGYECEPVRALPTTQEEAVAYYAKNYPAEDICAPLKKNAPFQCVGAEPKTFLVVLANAWANTGLAFSILASVCVAILYKCKKAKEPDFLQEDELKDRLAKMEAADLNRDAKIDAVVAKMEAAMAANASA